MTTLGRVKKLAEEARISLKELAIKLEMGENSIYSWKVKTPGADKLKLVADYFNVSTDYLLDRTDNPYMDNEQTEIITEIVSHIDKNVSEEEMNEIINYIELIKLKYGRK
ncbi:helix-turn-helix domain-containing protein [Listeria ivanovii]|uniref:Helix-turn-helix transcriptional regulator n=2 Tax=Listeria ivanovii TaxID=1638 RepID=A0ABS1G875_LISIV|nr:helix-turn-helix transcriptional regulator [Listeria ivanovii]EFR97869.1 toxin-antitoxin system, antitoxin component, Xre family [Listeria ivanovii FSL F6-596]AIS59061.1 Cro/Cl family transcriptional regulator [Listeria ivanovii subsp. londoniensis]AIS61907.1 Cro/Cl family transcriptional regulator [Listeria ivanovii subsp. londoniensis]MBC2254719.1 helix-turn-helix transcriptional regulator [Listeria ivanovii]MBK1963068.1 helix-turn-helix transcriptional regulator [Listeria ivanovii subsp.